MTQIFYMKQKTIGNLNVRILGTSDKHNLDAIW